MAQKKTGTKPTPDTQAGSTSDRIVKIWLRFERFGWDAAGILIAYLLI